MRTVFLENNDSFSWNVVDLLPVERRTLSLVHGAGEALRHLPEAELLIIGPGPLDPVRAGLLEVVHAAAERRLPTLGICLGHQAIGMAFGARLVRTTPCHGHRADVRFSPSRLFPGVVGTLEAMRYHSLSLTDIASPLRAIASVAGGPTMAVEHESLPMAGLQFHPDSFGTPRGAELVEAFLRAVS